MSDVILNGVRESFGSESCAVDFTVEPGDLRVTLDVEFNGPACTIEANVDRPAAVPTPQIAEPIPTIAD